MLVNSGSSANLAAPSCLTSFKLDDRQLRPGDEVIAVAAAFPTTVNPIIQNGLVPVFVDVQVPTYNIDTSQLEAAWSAVHAGRHGGPYPGESFQPSGGRRIRGKHSLWLVEDCCDALVRGSRAGTWEPSAILRPAAFTPPTISPWAREGPLLRQSPRLKTLIESFRDWGRDCWCALGQGQHLRQAL